MCGIAGISITIEKDAPFWKKWIYQFSEDIDHRGYDDAGVVLSLRSSDPLPVQWGKEHYSSDLQYMPQRALLPSISEQVNGMLLHRRLSIIAPTERAHQPMCDATGRYWISYNGEIFNYTELRSQYNIDTVTDSDTEVLLEMWAKMEEKCLPLLDGFFAFCIYDSKENTYTIVRDRTGVKPLYYTKRSDAFAFSSEETSLRKFTGFDSVNPQAMYLHVKHGMSDAVNWFDGVETLKPGHWLKWHPNLRNVILRRWYFPTSLHSFNEQGDIRELLEESIKRRMRSDVPIGFAMSGGLDSTAIVALASKHLDPHEQTHFFSVISKGYNQDESEWQEKVLSAFPGQRHTIDAQSMDTSDLEDLIVKTRRPAVAWNNVAHFLLCKQVRDTGVTVLFNGQGADEIFGGYPDHFVEAWKAEKNDLLPLMKDWPIEVSKLKAVAWKRNLRKSMSQNWKHRLDRYLWGDIFPVDVIEQNTIELHPPVKNLADLMLGEYYGSTYNQKFYGRLYQMLLWEERNGMAFQLESRNPFADDMLLPMHFLGKKSLKELSENGRSKGLLREAVKDIIPKSIYERADKKGFTVPEKALIQKHGKEWEEWLMTSQLDEIINRRTRERWVTKFDKLSNRDLLAYFRVSTLGRFLIELKENDGK